MSSIVVSGDTSGSVSLSAPAVAGTVTVTLPSTSGVMAVTGGSPSFADITATGNLTVNGNTTLGDASTDTILMTGAPSIGGAGLGMGMGFRNRIINGAMVINQRGFSGAITDTSNTTYTVDRWYAYGSAASKFTVAQSSTAPTGFNNSLLATSSSAYTVGAAELFILGQSIEGFNTADLGWGTASAKTVTLSFQVYSSLTGTFGGAILNSAQTRNYPFTYTISSANTWTQISITIAGDTSGTWIGATNGVGLKIYWGLGVGSTYSGTAGAWTGSLIFSATGATSVVGTSGATFYITGVQLEKGSTATSFDYRPYGTELALCQRYFYKTFAQDVAPANGLALSTESTVAMYTTTNGQAMYYTYSATMRTTPTITFYRSLSRGVTDGQWAVYNGSVWTSATTQTTGVSSVGFTPVVTTGTLTQFAAYLLSGHYTSSAEL
jgi:hypothetical protein